MKNNGINIVHSAMIGMAVGTALTAAGVMYIKESKDATNKAISKAKESKRIITRAGESIIREITD